MTSDIRDVEELLDRQIRYNMAIAEEGMKHDYGANIGKVLLASYGDDVKSVQEPRRRQDRMPG